MSDVTPIVTTPFSYALDELTITKSGLAVFDDTFGNGPPPIGGSFNGTPVAFATSGSTWTDVNGKAVLSASGATANSVGFDSVSALLITNTSPQGTGAGQSNLGLKENATFTVSGTFDLAIPPTGTNGGYGIELTNQTPTQSPTEVVQVEVQGTNSGGAAVNLYQANFATDTFTLLQSITLTSQQLASNTEIKLDLNHNTAGASTITASFELGNGASFGAANSFSPATTPHAFNLQTYTRAAVFAFGAPTPSIYGTAQAGQMLTAIPATNGSDNALSFAWYSSADNYTNPIVTGETYEVQNGDIGQQLEVKVTASNGSGTNSATSAATAAVIAASPYFWGNAYAPLQPTPGVHVFASAAQGDAFTGAAALFYSSTPGYDPVNDPTGPYSLTRTILPVDPFFLPTLAGSQVVQLPTAVTLPARSNLIVPSINTANGVESEGIAAYVNAIGRQQPQSTRWSAPEVATTILLFPFKGRRRSRTPAPIQSMYSTRASDKIAGRLPLHTCPAIPSPGTSTPLRPVSIASGSKFLTRMDQRLPAS